MGMAYGSQKKMRPDQKPGREQTKTNLGYNYLGRLVIRCEASLAHWKFSN